MITLIGLNINKNYSTNYKDIINIVIRVKMS